MSQIGQINLSTDDFNKIVSAVQEAGCCGGSQGVGSTEGGSGGSVGALVNVGFTAPAAPGQGNIFFEFLEGTTTTRVKLTVSAAGSSTLQQLIV